MALLSLHHHLPSFLLAPNLLASCRTLIPSKPPSPIVPNPTPLFHPLTSRSIPLRRQSLLLPPSKATSFTVTGATDFDGTFVSDAEDGLDEGSPWEGAVVYQRDASVSHVEYCTTLERLGLEKLSSKVSRSRAAAMGIRLPVKRSKDMEFGDGETPVLVSLDVSRRRRRLKLDGIVRTVITLGCNRCGEAAAECVYSNFSLLLTEDPVEEPDEINMGVIFGEDKFKSSDLSSSSEEEDDETEIDLEDRLYFPAEEKEIDISKHIRDYVHIEVTINAVCDPNCKGLCLRCGTNLNKSRCSCNEVSPVQSNQTDYGPLRDLKKQIQQSR